MSSPGMYFAAREGDPSFPDDPSQAYSECGWENWTTFLGLPEHRKYSIYEDAVEAVRRLGIKNSVEYKKRFSEDAKLPAHPEEKFNEWTDWPSYCGQRRYLPYESLREAQDAVGAMNIKSRQDYYKVYKQDLRLVANPNITYHNKGWVGWRQFLDPAAIGFYTYAEAQRAVKRLRFKSGVEYREQRFLDPRLPSKPAETYKKNGWISWYEFLGAPRPTLKYATLVEAKATIMALRIQTGAEYRVRCKLDPRLPTNPNLYYKADWENWSQFFNRRKKSFYSTYHQAYKSVHRLGCKSRKDYSRLYKNDPRLPSLPDDIYKHKGWTDWNTFLNIKKQQHYPTYEEAAGAIKRLSIKSIKEYHAVRKKDPLLHSAPHERYANAGWVSWPDYFGLNKNFIYVTYEEAKTATLKLNINSVRQYKELRCQDIRLPAEPSATFKGKGWKDWYSFLDNPHPAAPERLYPKTWSSIQKWLEHEVGLAGKKCALRAFISRYLIPASIPDDPTYLLRCEYNFDIDAYQEFIDSQTDQSKSLTHRACSNFYKWVFDQRCSVILGNERIVTPGFRNPFETTLGGFANSLASYRPNQTTKPPLAYEYILRARKYLVPEGEQAFTTKPSLKSLTHLHSFFNGRPDWIEVNKNIINAEDANCVWRSRTVERIRNGKKQKTLIYQLWSPVRFVALYTLLRYPLRGQQILWLDSGESDVRIPIYSGSQICVSWITNENPVVQASRSMKRPQGVIQPGPHGVPVAYVTTNKTGLKPGGYTIDWIPEDLIYWLLVLRDWQKKYNSIHVAMPWVSLGNLQTNKNVLISRGSQCFLFRDRNGRPISTNAAFEYTLPALLYKIQRDGELLAVSTPENYRKPFTSIYTPHCLRVSLLTALVVDGDAPIEIVSKLAGHGSLVITIYYTKPNVLQMRRRISEAEKRAGVLAQEQFAERVRITGLSLLGDTLLPNNLFRNIIATDHSASSSVVFDYGICPMSAASCSTGGPCVTGGTFTEVPLGYLGEKNCLRCRFFLTGVPFLGGLVSLINEISLEAHVESQRFQDCSTQMEDLEREYYDNCQHNIPDSGRAKRKQLCAIQQQIAGKLDMLLLDFTAAHHFLKSIEKIVQENNTRDPGSEIRLLASDDLLSIVIGVEESTSQYHLLAEICQNATIYKSCNPSRALPLISQAIDRMALNNGLAPALFRLDDKQKLIVANELNTLLYRRLNSWEKINGLIAGDLTLLDIDSHEPYIEKVSDSIRSLLETKFPIRLSEELQR